MRGYGAQLYCAKLLFKPLLTVLRQHVPHLIDPELALASVEGCIREYTQLAQNADVRYAA